MKVENCEHAIPAAAIAHTLRSVIDGFSLAGISRAEISIAVVLFVTFVTSDDLDTFIDNLRQCHSDMDNAKEIFSGTMQ